MGTLMPNRFRVKTSSLKSLCQKFLSRTLCMKQIDDLNLTRINGLPVIHHAGYVCQLSPKHSFPMAKFNMLYDLLVSDGIIDFKQVLTPEHISQEAACQVHSEQYVEKFFSGHTTTQEQRVTGIPWSPGLVSRVRYETGGTVLAAQVAMKRGLACSTAGGTHHAFAGHGSGYCFLNDLAVAARLLTTEAGLSRVLVVDLDVHQGDGTAAIFADDDRVFTFSMHCEKNFPLKKQRSDLDVGLELHTGDAAYLMALRGHLPALLDLFRPELVLYDAGVDPHVNDVLGRLDLSDQGLFDRDYLVLSEVVGRGIPCASVIGGGYSRDLSELVRRHSIVHRAATRVYRETLSL